MGFYSEKVVDHFKEPRNTGYLPDADGIGEIGDPSCGDFMRVFIKVEEDIIADVKYQIRGCPASIAVASVMTELAIGKDLDYALMLTDQDVLEALDGLPPEKLHCSVLGITGLRKAIQDHFMRYINGNSEEGKKIGEQEDRKI
jgi:nitrogen fixation protein NifU and related proteins